MKAVQRLRKTTRQAANKAADFDDPVPAKLDKKHGKEAEGRKRLRLCRKRICNAGGLCGCRVKGKEGRRVGFAGAQWWFGRRGKLGLYVGCDEMELISMLNVVTMVGAGDSLENAVFSEQSNSSF